jgi:hypothetical protein
MRKTLFLVTLLCSLSIGAFATCSGGGSWAANSFAANGGTASVTHTPPTGCTTTLTSFNGSIYAQSADTPVVALELTWCLSVTCQLRENAIYNMGAPVHSSDHITVSPSLTGITGAVTLEFTTGASGANYSVAMTGVDQ